MTFMKVKAKRIFAAAAAGTFALSALAPQALAAETDVEVEDPSVLGTKISSKSLSRSSIFPKLIPISIGTIPRRPIITPPLGASLGRTRTETDAFALPLTKRETSNPIR